MPLSNDHHLIIGYDDTRGGRGGGVDDGDEEYYQEEGLSSAEFEFHIDDIDGGNSRKKSILKHLKLWLLTYFKYISFSILYH